MIRIKAQVIYITVMYVPVVKIPHVDDQKSDGANHNRHDPTVCG